MKATNIEWDVDCKADLESLPTEIDIPKGMTDVDEISDYISDETCMCHKGFCLVDDTTDDFYEDLRLEQMEQM